MMSQFWLATSSLTLPQNHQNKTKDGRISFFNEQKSSNVALNVKDLLVGMMTRPGSEPDEKFVGTLGTTCSFFIHSEEEAAPKITITIGLSGRSYSKARQRIRSGPDGRFEKKLRRRSCKGLSEPIVTASYFVSIPNLKVTSSVKITTNCTRLEVVNALLHQIFFEYTKK